MSPAIRTREVERTHRATAPRDAVHFRCGCGRSVATDATSEAAATGRCSRCRARSTHRAEPGLHRR